MAGAKGVLVGSTARESMRKQGASTAPSVQMHGDVRPGKNTRDAENRKGKMHQGKWPRCASSFVLPCRQARMRERECVARARDGAHRQKARKKAAARRVSVGGM
uniref:Uncharacterized protein n=1 Tax=Chrysotila carterae TaxID=13221 RepID=A0A7S4B3W1_CHRCT